MIFNTLFSNFTHRVASHATILHAMVLNSMCACFKLRENQKTFFQYFFELIFRNTAALFKIRSLHSVRKLQKKELSLCHRIKFLMPISIQPDVVNLNGISSLKYLRWLRRYGD